LLLLNRLALHRSYRSAWRFARGFRRLVRTPPLDPVPDLGASGRQLRGEVSEEPAQTLRDNPA